MAMAKKLMPIEKRAAIALTMLYFSFQLKKETEVIAQCNKNKDKKLTNKTSHENIVDIANFYKWDMKNFARKLAIFNFKTL